ncbi:hypothetical protein ABK040_007417 [Willaertia magna]
MYSSSGSDGSNKSEEEATLKEHTVLNFLKEIIPFSYCSSITFEKKKEIELKPFNSSINNNEIILNKKTMNNNEFSKLSSFHFALKKKIEPTTTSFTLKYNELVSDVYFEIKDTIFTIESNIWSKCRKIARNGVQEECVIVKCIEPSEIDNVVSTKLEIDLPTFWDMIDTQFTSTKSEIIDALHTERQVYSYNNDKDIELTLGSTLLPDGRFYNHGILSCCCSTEEKESKLLEVLSEIGEEYFIFPHTSPLVIRLLMQGKEEDLKDLITNDKLLEDIDNYLTSTGFYYPEEEEEEWKFIGEVYLKDILN